MTKKRSQPQKALKSKEPQNPLRRNFILSAGALGLFLVGRKIMGGLESPQPFNAGVSHPLSYSGNGTASRLLEYHHPDFTGEITFDALHSSVSDPFLEELVAGYRARTYDTTFLEERRQEITSLENFPGGPRGQYVPLETLAEITKGDVVYRLLRHPSAEADLTKLGSRYQEFLEFVHDAIQRTIVRTRSVFAGPVHEFDFKLDSIPGERGETNNETFPESSYIRLNTQRWVTMFLSDKPHRQVSLPASLEHELSHVHSFVTAKFYNQPLFGSRPKFWREFPAMLVEIDGHAVAESVPVSEALIRRELQVQLGLMKRRKKSINPGMVNAEYQTYDVYGTRALGFYVAGVAFKSLGSEHRFHAYVAALLHERIDSLDAFNALNQRFDIRTSRGSLTYANAVVDLQKIYGAG